MLPQLMSEFIMPIGQLQDCGSSFLSYIFNGPGILQFSQMGAILNKYLAKVVYIVSFTAVTLRVITQLSSPGKELCVTHCGARKQFQICMPVL